MSLIRFFDPSLNTSTSSPLVRFNAFQHEIDRLLGLPSNNHEATSLGNWSPVLDLHQDKDHLFVKVELPGMKKENIALSLHDDLLTITGERHQEGTQPGKASLRTERFFGRFERAIHMPTQVDGTRVSASYEDGILTVTLPKAEAAKPRQIEIGVK